MTNKTKGENMTQQEKLKQFIKQNGLTMDCKQVEHNPIMAHAQSKELYNSMTHYKVTIKRRFKVYGNYLDTRYGFKQMTLVYSQGSAFKEQPNLESVLECLYSDSNYEDNLDDFCDSLGFSQETPEERKKSNIIFQATKKQTDKLKKLLDNDLSNLASVFA